MRIPFSNRRYYKKLVALKAAAEEEEEEKEEDIWLLSGVEFTIMLLNCELID